MRHNKKFNHLGRKKAHREAMLSNMAASLILHKRIFTTVAKAKALRVYVEPMLTRAKDAAKLPTTQGTKKVGEETKTVTLLSAEATHARRVVFSELQNKHAVTELFGPVAEKIANRPGGYTRILKTGNRLGDNAAMCFIELVDFNAAYTQAKNEAKKDGAKTRRSRRSSGKKAEAAAESAE